MKAKRFSIYSKIKENNSELYNKLSSFLLEQGFILDNINPDYIFVLGGDGTFLRAIHNFKYTGKFVLINTGHLGFFSDYEKEEIDKFINDFKSKKEIIEKTYLYTAKIKNKKYYFLNDFSLQSFETCFLDLYINNELFTSVRSNGIVVSSPVGTTGYLTSLNSPVIVNRPDIYQYSTISPCYNRLSINPINKAIINGDDTLKVVIKEGKIKSYMDGIEIDNLNAQEVYFKLEKTKELQIIRFDKISSVKRLRKNISGLED